MITEKLFLSINLQYEICFEKFLCDLNFKLHTEYYFVRAVVPQRNRGEIIINTFRVSFS